MPSPSPVRQGRGGRGEEGEDPAETQAGPEEAEISGDTLLVGLGPGSLNWEHGCFDVMDTQAGAETCGADQGRSGMGDAEQLKFSTPPVQDALRCDQRLHPCGVDEGDS